LNKEIVKKYSNNNYVALVVLAMSLALLSTTAIQATPANAANTNATQQAGAAANQTGEKAQAGAANVMQKGNLKNMLMVGFRFVRSVMSYNDRFVDVPVFTKEYSAMYNLTRD
jgi:hypothetical protein